MRRASQSAPPPRPGADASEWNAYAMAKLQEQLRKTNLLAQQVEREFAPTNRALVSKSFTNARPLSRSEQETLAREEAGKRRTARLLQVREQDRIHAQNRRLAFDEARTRAARFVAEEYQRESLEDDFDLEEEEETNKYLQAGDVIELQAGGRFDVARKRTAASSGSRQRENVVYWYDGSSSSGGDGGGKFTAMAKREEEEEQEQLALVRTQLGQVKRLLARNDARVKAFPEDIERIRAAQKREEEDARRLRAREYDLTRRGRRGRRQAAAQS